MHLFFNYQADYCVILVDEVYEVASVSRCNVVLDSLLTYIPEG